MPAVRVCALCVDVVWKVDVHMWHHLDIMGATEAMAQLTVQCGTIAFFFDLAEPA